MKNTRYFGLHFDFHALNDVEIGLRTTQEDIEQYILAAKPDFIQCDSKGHPGNCSYPTKVGKTADKLRKDNLRIWADAAKAHNIPLYVHYSGVIDGEFCKAHPECAAVNEDGEKTDRISLFNDRYLDELMIPEIKEMITEYGIQGVWVDGDCWGVSRDYSDNAKPYLKEGLTQREHNNIMRAAFLRYLQKYTDELHEFKQDFHVISNWAYTSYIPEKLTMDLDFLSGDFQPNNSVHEARYESRCMALRGKPWDLMAWGFELTHWTEKSSVQLMQEAAMVVTLGGGFQIYVRQNEDGSAPQTFSNRIAEVGDFVRPRRFLYQKTPLAQVAILYSGDSYYQKSNIFNAAGATRALIGTLNATLDAQYTANVLYEYQLDELAQYKIVIIPQWEYLTDETKAVLSAYAQNGGNLVIVGVEASRQFGELLNANLGETLDMSTAYIMAEDGTFALIGGLGEKVEVLDLKNGSEWIYRNYDVRDTGLPAYRIDACGKGKIAYIPFDFGNLYFDARSYASQNLLKNVLINCEKPFIEINRKHIDLTLQKDENGVILNLINMQQGRHSLNYLVYDDIAPIYDVVVKINKAYTNVTMPLGEEFVVEKGEDFTIIKLKVLEIHTAIVLKK